mmetsp:Transcript_887/g.1391  ORF Transcript_887/g.1391 Transcript_887/m.1391 type:complete len:279 (+) Transcript_887:19-855(+)
MGFDDKVRLLLTKIGSSKVYPIINIVISVLNLGTLFIGLLMIFISSIASLVYVKEFATLLGSGNPFLDDDNALGYIRLQNQIVPGFGYLIYVINMLLTILLIVLQFSNIILQIPALRKKLPLHHKRYILSGVALISIFVFSSMGFSFLHEAAQLQTFEFNNSLGLDHERFKSFYQLVHSHNAIFAGMIFNNISSFVTMILFVINAGIIYAQTVNEGDPYLNQGGSLKERVEFASIDDEEDEDTYQPPASSNQNDSDGENNGDVFVSANGESFGIDNSI